MGVEYEDVGTRAGGGTFDGVESAEGLDTLSSEARGGDSFGGDREEDRCLAPTGDVSGLRPSIEESRGGAAGDRAEESLGGVGICAGVGSTSGEDTTGGRGADEGDSERAGAAEARGGVDALVRDVDAADRDGAAARGGVFMAASRTEEASSGR